MKALITGITGQDDVYLAELLLAKGYKVYGTYRRTSFINFWRLEELGVAQHPNLHMVDFDRTNIGSCIRLLLISGPTVIYNIATQSFVDVSFDKTCTTAQIIGLGVLHILEATRIVNPKPRLYQANISGMFGKDHAFSQDEPTSFHLRSPHGAANLYYR